jgi:uncharacterized protein YcfL
MMGCSPYSKNVPNQSISLPPQVIINNPQLQKEIRIGIGSDRTNNNDIMEAFVNVTNNTENESTLYYRFRWFDVEDYEVGENMSMWKPLFLGAKDFKKVVGIAPTTKAESFKFYIKK